MSDLRYHGIALTDLTRGLVTSNRISNVDFTVDSPYCLVHAALCMTQRSQVIGLVVRQGLRLVAIGVVLGLPASLLALREISSLLVGVSARDPLTYAVAVLLLAATAALSALVPARRAAGVDPKTALVEG